MEPKTGRQTPTQSVVLPYSCTLGQEAISEYHNTGRKALEWQELIIYDILVVNEDGLFVHTKFGYSVPRRNGKNEIIAIRELHGLKRGEHILHSAHRVNTSSAAYERLCSLLDKAHVEYTSIRAEGREKITLKDGGRIYFRTRSSKGGLGEGFDLLVIDEAQEYTDDQESALKYTVTDSKNPQTILCGTPPTAYSSGTVFTKLRQRVLSGQTTNTGWAEWSVETMTDPLDKDAWYETNPSLGTVLTERSILDEIGSDPVDDNIQRLGLWIKYNQKSAISSKEWDALRLESVPALKEKLHIGIKYGKSGAVAMSIAVKTTEDKIFVETIDCRSKRAGNAWIINFLREADVNEVVIDGAGGQQLLSAELKDARVKLKVIMPTVKEIIAANAAFEQGVFRDIIRHCGQPSLAQAAGNCEKRAIGSNGGFGYKALREDIDIALLDSVILAYWAASEYKSKKKQRISY